MTSFILVMLIYFADVFVFLAALAVMIWFALLHEKNVALWCAGLIAVEGMIFLAGFFAYVQLFGSDGEAFYANAVWVNFLPPAACILALLILVPACSTVRQQERRIFSRR